MFSASFFIDFRRNKTRKSSHLVRLHTICDHKCIYPMSYITFIINEICLKHVPHMACDAIKKNIILVVSIENSFVFIVLCHFFSVFLEGWRKKNGLQNEQKHQKIHLFHLSESQIPKSKKIVFFTSSAVRIVHYANHTV